MNNTNFGKRLKELRKSMGYTQQSLAEKAGIDEKHLCRIENGKYFPTYSTLRKLLNAMNLTIEETGLELEQAKINNNPLFSKAVQILNSAENDDELNCYIEVLKSVQKAFKLHK